MGIRKFQRTGVRVRQFRLGTNKSQGRQDDSNPQADVGIGASSGFACEKGRSIPSPADQNVWSKVHLLLVAQATVKYSLFSAVAADVQSMLTTVRSKMWQFFLLGLDCPLLTRDEV